MSTRDPDHHLVAHLYALYDAANRRLPPWVGEVEASNPEVHARVMALGLWFSLSHTQGNLTEAGAALLRAHPRVSDAPAVLTDPARGDVHPERVDLTPDDDEPRCLTPGHDYDCDGLGDTCDHPDDCRCDDCVDLDEAAASLGDLDVTDLESVMALPAHGNHRVVTDYDPTTAMAAAQDWTSAPAPAAHRVGVPPAASGQHILVCPTCGDELQCRYPAWFYDRDGQLVLADIDYEAKCESYFCSTCSDHVYGPIEAREPASDGSAAAVDEILRETGATDPFRVPIPPDVQAALERDLAIAGFCLADLRGAHGERVERRDPTTVRVMLLEQRALALPPGASVEIQRPFDRFKKAMPDERLAELEAWAVGATDDGGPPDTREIQTLLAEVQAFRAAAPTVLIAHGQLDQSQADKIEAFVEEMKSGIGRAGRPVILVPNDEIEVKFEMAAPRPLVPAELLANDDRAGNRATAEAHAEAASAAAGIPPATPESFACRKCGSLPSEGCRTPGREGCPYNEQPRAPGQCKWCEKPATEGNGLCKTCDQDIPF